MIDTTTPPPNNPKKNRGLLRWTILLLCLAIAVGGGAYYQYQKDAKESDSRQIQELIRMKSMLKAKDSIDRFEKKWGNSDTLHIFRARWFRQKFDQEMFEKELKLAKSLGIPELRIRQERNLFNIQVGNFSGFNGDYKSFVNNPLTAYEDNTIALLEGLIYRNDLLTANMIAKDWAETVPESPWPRLYNGKVERIQRYFQKSREILEKLYKEHPDFVPLWSELSEIYIMLRLPEEAITLVEKALSTDPENGFLKRTLAKCLLELNRFEEARKVIEPFIQPQDSVSDARTMLGRVLFNLGEFEESIKILTPVVENWPDDIETNTTLASIYTALGDDAKAEHYDMTSKKGISRMDAIEDNRQRINKEQLNAELYYELGHDLLECVSRDEGRLYLSKSLEIDGSLVQARKDLIRYFKAAGDESSAKAQQEQINILSQSNSPP